MSIIVSSDFKKEKLSFLHTNLYQINTFIYTGKKRSAFLTYDITYTLKKIIKFINSINNQNLNSFEDLIFFVLNSNEIKYDHDKDTISLVNFKIFKIITKIKNYKNIKDYYDVLHFEDKYDEKECTLIVNFLMLCNHLTSIVYTNFYNFTKNTINKHFMYQSLFVYKCNILLSKLLELMRKENSIVFFDKLRFICTLEKSNTQINQDGSFYVTPTVSIKFTLPSPFLGSSQTMINCKTYGLLTTQLNLYKYL